MDKKAIPKMSQSKKYSCHRSEVFSTLLEVYAANASPLTVEDSQHSNVPYVSRRGFYLFCFPSSEFHLIY